MKSRLSGHPWSSRYSRVVTPIPARSEASTTVTRPQGVRMKRLRRVLRDCSFGVAHRQFSGP